MNGNSPDRFAYSASTIAASENKLVDFVAHKEEVTCIKFSRKSLRIIATGGADAKVNIWNNWDRFIHFTRHSVIHVLFVHLNCSF